MTIPSHTNHIRMAIKTAALAPAAAAVLAPLAFASPPDNQLNWAARGHCRPRWRTRQSRGEGYTPSAGSLVPRRSATGTIARTGRT